ncbi:MAG: hypothetical protein DI538_09885 [Azospira oryzae]|jgi:hypothetical protein|nr:MAG: hypothetical protein DI538_09885 [Azospira oryzae]
MRVGRLPFVLVALVSLITGLLAGLHRMGWTLPLTGVSPDHGAIMVGGFLGTLIILEKIIPLKKNVLYVFPIISGASVVLFFIEQPIYSVACLVLASAGLSIIFLIYWIRERSTIYFLMVAGAICWLTGNILLIIHNFYPISLPWWMAFVLLIITAERLELMKFLPVSRNQKLIFIGMLLTFVTGCLISFHRAGNYVAAFSLVGSSIWLMRHDVVALNLKKKDLPRYVGVALLSGYFALLLSGIFLLILPEQPLGYDILVHSFFIGFVFSMIFAHGPIILPGVLGISAKPYHPLFFIWLALLHGSWITRAISDITLDMQLRKYSGLISAIAIICYFLSLAIITIRTQRGKPV